MRLTSRILILVLAISIARGDEKTESPDGLLKADDPKSLREMIEQANNKMKPMRIPSLELAVLKETVKKTPSVSSTLSENLTKALKESPGNVMTASVLGIDAAEAIADPNINVIDSHVAQITSDANSTSQGFKPDQEEMKRIMKAKYSGSNLLNVYRENLKVESIQEEKDFRIGEGVEQWKALTLSVDSTVLVGRRQSSIVFYVGRNETYENIATIPFDIEPGSQLLIETFNLWDSNQERARYLVLAAVNQQLIWHEIRDNEVVEFQRWNLLKEIDSMVHFSHDGLEILLISTSDAQGGNVQAELIEFNVPDDQFWVLQVFPLQNRSTCMMPLDLGREFIVTFVQDNAVLIYRHEIAQHSRGKFTLFKTIEAANVSTISAFRIGGHSYLAIGGDEPQILRYLNGDFVPQTILSQSFGFVEQFFPVTIRTYRDDLMLLVQHRLEMGTHSVAVIDALVWNGIAFENALSVPCNISADPNANGFTCMLDLERDEGLLGAEFIHIAKEHRLYILVPRHEVHSGLFRVKYSMVDAEDPVMKDMEQMKKSIELINHMLEYEDQVKSEVETALACGINPKDDVTFDNLNTIEAIETDYLELGKNVILDSDVVDFVGVSWTQGDFLIDLDGLEAAVAANEQRLRVIDDEINMVHSNNRRFPREPKDSEVHNLGSFTLNGQLKTASIRPARQSEQPTTEASQIFRIGPVPGNGQLNPQTMRIEPQEHRRRPRQTAPIEESFASELRVDNIDLETFNGIPFDDLLFLENGQLIVPEKDVIFTESVQIDNLNMLNDGKINGVDFSHEVLAVESPNPLQHMNFENIVVRDLNVNLIKQTPVDLVSLKSIDIPDAPLNITADHVVFNDDLKIERINGIVLDEFVAKLVPKHLTSTISELHIGGDLVIVGDRSKLDAQLLNGLPFPSGYVLREGNGTTITGKKTFVNDLITTAVDIEEGGTIDGIQPFNIITLDQDQEITGETTFSQLEVTNKLEVKGTIAGRQLDDFLPNPTLEDVQEIAAAVSFTNLVVEGDVIIEDTYNGENLEKMLSQIVYESPDGSDVVIKGPKIFQNLEVQGDIAVGSSFLNDRSLDDFVLNDREQTVNIETLSGHVYFSSLKLDGLFDKINATELERSCVRTYGDQFIETPLVLGPNHHVEARSVEVRTHLNEIPIEDYIFIDQPVRLPSAKFEDLKVDELILEGDITGPGVFSSLNVNDIATNYLSKSRKQKIAVPVTIQSLTTNGTFSGKTINGMDFDVFLQQMRGIKNYKKLIVSGALPIKDLIIAGDVTLNTLNGRNFNQLLQNVIWLNRPNDLELSVNFLDDVTVNGPLTLHGGLNKKPFKKFIENWVSNTENPLVIHGGKLFEKDITVEQSVQTKNLNGILFENLMKLDDALEAMDLEILGNVQVDSLNVERTLDGASMRDFKELYSYDAPTDTHIITADVQFNQPLIINYLDTPVLNNYNVTEWRANMIRLNESNVQISSPKIFVGSITTPQGFYADYINDIPTGFLDHVVLANDESMVTINSDLEFTNDVYAQLIAISGDLYTRYVNGCDTLEWTRVGLMTNRKLELDGTLHIEGSALQADVLEYEFINGIPFKEMITLTTNQTFDYPLRVTSLRVNGPLIVFESLNGVNIEAARANTVMKNAEHQVITAKSHFTNIRAQTLTAKGKVNGHRIEDVVLLDSSPIITSAVNFRSLEAPSMFTENLVSGVNLRKWYDNVLWARGKENQVVTGNWKVQNLRITGDVIGNGLIDGMPMTDIEANLKHSISESEKLLANYSVQYRDMCYSLSASANKSLHSIHILKHFELDFKIDESTEIFSHFALTTKAGGNFFLVNTNCTTNVYKWKKTEERFEKLYQVETGVVYEWSLVNNAIGDTFIVTNSRMEAEHPCRFGGLNVWKMNGDQIFHVTTITTQTEVLHLHTSQVQPGRFFALDILDRVTHFDVFGQMKEFWQLPAEHLNYSFLPPEVTKDLTLFNGRKVFMLESKFKRRQVREWFGKEKNLLKSLDNQHSLGAKVDPKRLQDPSMVRMLTTPAITGQPLMSIEDRKHFMSKVREVGDSVQRSLQQSFGKLSKLTIKSDRGDKLVSTRPLKATTLIKDRMKPTTETSVKAQEEQEVKLEPHEVLEKIEVTTEKAPTASTESITEELKATPAEVESPSAEAEKPTKKKSKLTSFMIKQPVAGTDPKAAADVTKTEIFGTFMEKLKSLSESVQSVLNLRKQLEEKKESDSQVGDQQESTTNELTITETKEEVTESSTTASTSSDPTMKATSEAETSETTKATTTTNEVTSEKITGPPSPQPESPKAPNLQLPSIPITPRIVIQTEAATSTQESATVGSVNFPDDLPEVFPENFDMTLTDPISTLPEESEKNFEDANENLEAAGESQKNITEVGETLEQNVPIEVLSGSGVRETDNPFIPERGTGELIMMYVGPNNQKRPLYAVTRNRNSEIIGNNNIIEIYSDIFEGFIYQYIHSSDPSHLIALQFRDETLLAFLENRSEIQIFIYRGIQGFVDYKRIKLPGYAVDMTSVSLPPRIDYKCDHHYLAVRMETEILFYRVKIDGNCGLRDVKCDDLV